MKTKSASTWRASVWATDGAEVDGDIVKVEDLFFDRELLLRGAYDRSFARYGDEKAHAVSSTAPITAINAASIKLAWSAAPHAPTNTVKNAFISAGGDYNSTCNAAPPNDCLISISQGNNGPWIVVHEVPSGAWPPPQCTSTQVACATPPNGVVPGGHIYVKSGALTPGCPTWTSSAIAHVARHELGHALGFNHPGVGTLLSGTTSQVGKPPPGYGTIMNNVGINASCNFSPTVLQTDDKAGLRSLY